MGKNVTDVGPEKKLAKHELKKHAATIHCSNTLSLLQRKISNALLYHAYNELLLREEHEITVKQLCNLISYSGNNHAVIKDALKGLLSTVIEWNVVSDTTGQEDWSASAILASVSLRGPKCLFAYSPRMKQLLHSPSMFGKINLFIQSQFKSSYGLALYENCIRYRDLPQTKWFEIDLFRKLMGVPPGKYPIFRDFKKRVLDKSIEEVNTYSDLIVEAELLREGRQVAKVRFHLKERAKRIRIGISTETPIEEPSLEKSIISKLIAHFGLSERQANKALEKYGSGFVTDKMELIENSPNFQRGKVKNLAAYFMSALKNDYQPPKPSQDAVLKIKHRRTEEQAVSEELNKVVERIKTKYFSHREKLIDQAIENLPETIKSDLFQAFYQQAADSIAMILKLQRKKYSKETVIHSPHIKVLLRKFALEFVPDLKNQLTSLEEFVEKSPEKQKKAWAKHQSLQEA